MYDLTPPRRACLFWGWTCVCVLVIRTYVQGSDEEELELRRETAKLLHARAGARARVEANSATIFDITGEVPPESILLL